MRTIRTVLGTSVVVLVAACSSPPDPTSDKVVVPSNAPSPASGSTLTYFEGSFDAHTSKLELAFRDPATGALRPEATLPYGQSPGDVYLHTCGTHGDGYSNPLFAPPGVNSCIPNGICFQISPENGTGAPITNFVFSLDTITPSSVTFAINNAETSGNCSSTGAASPAPCVTTFNTNPMPATVGFPALTDHGCGSRSALALFDTSGNGGGSFTFTGHVTGN